MAPYELQSLERALEIVKFLSQTRSANLNEVAGELAINVTTCLRTMRVLERHGLVRRMPDGRGYALGMHLVELGALALSAMDVIGMLRPTASALVKEFGVTAHVGMLRDGMVTVVDKVDPLDSLVRYSLVGTRMPLHCSGMGKALLALHDPAGWAELGVNTPLAAYTKATISTMKALKGEIAVTVLRGHSIEREEWQAGYSCVGSAFRFGDQEIAVSLSGQVESVRTLEARGARLRTAVREFIEVHGGAIAVSL
jgi:DNA-binding IclR family transcriptional regulator